jgi:Uma2 family endonuclease
MSAITAVTTPPAGATSPPAARPRRRGRAVVIPAVDWKTYTRLLKVFDDRPRLRLTYDRGTLEIMVTSQEHEGDSAFLAQLIAALAREFRLPMKSGGSVTIKRKRMQKGLEPDKCFWLANAAKVVGAKQLDLSVHPPPDLAVEVDVSRSSMNRLRIYATLGVPEVWRLDGDELHFHQLAGKSYVVVSASPTFPGVGPADIMAFVKQARGAADELATVDAFRAWLQQRTTVSPPAPPASPPPP